MQQMRAKNAQHVLVEAGDEGRVPGVAMHIVEALAGSPGTERYVIDGRL